MWTHISLNLEIVWEDALYRVVAIWNEDGEGEPIVIERGGRVPLSDDRSPEGMLWAAACALHQEDGRTSVPPTA
jgi:hypothetical protein